MLRRIGVALGLLAVAAGVAAVALTTARRRGYFGPVFAPDAASVYVVVRDVNASVVGLGYTRSRRRPPSGFIATASA